MGSGPDGQPTLKVDPELLKKYGGQLLTAAGDLPDAPPPFIVPGTDAISQAVAEKLPMIEGGFQEALPQLKSEASSTATKVTEAAGHYANTDAELAANYEKHQFDSASPGGSGGGGGSDAMGQMGQMMSMPMQMASQAAQMPMQAMSAVAQVPQSIMQGVQQIGQMAGGLGGSSEGSSGAQAGKAAEDGVGQPADRKDGDRDKKDAESGASAGDAKAGRAPEPAPRDTPATTPVPQQSSPRHATRDPGIDL